ncbi:GNAT family N-acetyltransferase [Mesorhizobium xinjiangense]|uniref:GNAT family N-acetyltransferase n=1 Tax=Mesorhizobium xinjiangense TaxID=2678685 RepID=UPI001F37B0D3|nr:GNAT family N-acetyltransferase [Mesorhizobium xinjiangense]
MVVGSHGFSQTQTVLGRIGQLEVRLARNSSEIAAAQEVRFRVFYDELGAKRQFVHELESRDSDRFDAVCDHLLVVDTAIGGPDRQQIVGTYRLLRQEQAMAAGGFYSDEEFELEALMARHPHRRFLELGRSCVLPEYRSKRTVELLWQGIWAYCRRHAIDVMTGCASFPGVTPAAHAEALSFLAQNCRAEADWDVRAVASRYNDMDLVPAEAVDTRAALAAMPPLIKGYLRLGAKVGDGCVVDRDFRTTDIFIVLPVEHIADRYINYYGADAQRFAA